MLRIIRSQTHGHRANHQLCKPIVAVCAALAAAASGCTDGETTPTEPVPAPGQRQTQRRVRLDARLANAGCAVARTIDGTSTRVAVLSREDLPWAMPSLDSVWTRGKRPILLATPFAVAGSPNVEDGSWAVCLLPPDESVRREVRDAIGRVGPLLPVMVESVLQAGSVIPAAGRPAVAVASQALRDAVTPNRDPKIFRLGIRQASTTVRALPDGIAALSGEWTDDDDPVMLPPVTVTATFDAYIIDNLWIYWTVRRAFSFSDLVPVDYEYYDELCAAASDFYLAKDDEYWRMEELRQIAEALANAEDEVVCVRRTDRTICIDLFIQDSRALVFGGDDRDFDPYAGLQASRVQLYFNPDDLSWDVFINDTRIKFGIGAVTQEGGRLFDPEEDVFIRPDTTNPDVILVDLTFHNNFCMTRASCPSIDLFLRFTPNPSEDGGYKVHWIRDGFPAMGVYRWLPSEDRMATMAEDPQKVRGWLVAWSALLGSWWQSVNMPPACNVQ